MSRSRAALFCLLSCPVLPGSCVFPARGAPSSTAPTQGEAAYRDSRLAPEARAHDLVVRMTLDEKVSQMLNESPAIPRLGVAPYNWWSEGLHGIARSGYATVFPQAIGMAATWDPELVERIGEVVSIEARAKYRQALLEDNHSVFYGLTIWSPNINILRDPRWGRGQETYGEDPYLTSRLGVSFIKGLQGDDPRYYRTIATPKHFAVHSGPEPDRHKEDVKPSSYDLWDTYLPAFRAAVTEGRAGSLMCAYNSLYGTPACGSRFLLTDVLRKDWGFQGFVTSDCGAIDDFYVPAAHAFSPDAESAAAEAVKAGTDTNCGTTYASLVGAAQKHLISEAEIDAAVERLFTARIRLGQFDDADNAPCANTSIREIDDPKHAELALKAARESMVLLKNDGNVLPLDPEKIKTLAVVGPNAVALSSLEGNYNAIPRKPIEPLDGIRAEFRGTRVIYAQGSSFTKGVLLPVPRTVLRPRSGSREEGLAAEYFASEDLTGSPAYTRTDPEIDFDWTAAKPVPELPAQRFGVRWSGTIAAPVAGAYEFGIRFPECYPCDDLERYAVYLDGKLVAESNPSSATKERSRDMPHFTMNFPDALPHALRVEYRHRSALFGAGISLEWAPPAEALLQEAVNSARQADAVVAVLGLSPLLEGEEMPVHVDGFAGGDKTDLNLPAEQERLLAALMNVGKPVVVVLMNGSALAVLSAQNRAAAVLEAWYPGQSGGAAIAETLSGRNNPAGRLPMTFYSSVDDLPPFNDYSMKGRTYRYFRGKPLFQFGFGLSYTQFRYDHLKISTSRLHAGDSLRVEAYVSNIGTRDGDEVSELYLVSPKTDLSPRSALKGIQRISLRSGETKRIGFSLDARSMASVSRTGESAVEPGEYRIFVGGSQPSFNDASAAFTVAGRHPLPR